MLAAAGTALLALVVVSASGAMLAADDPAWRMESNSDGIALYRGAVSGTGVVPVKATMTVPGSIAEVSLVLEDIPRRREWMGSRTESVLLERASDYDQVEHLHVNMPWPVLDRTALIRATITVAGDRRGATITARSIDAHSADTLPKLVRATVHESTFQMTQTPAGVEVLALVFIDPGGSIPKWIVNYFSRRVARSTLAGLRKQVGRKLYAPARVEAMQRRIQAYADARSSAR